MKKIFYFLSLILMLLIVSCRDVEKSSVIDEGNYNYFSGSKIYFQQSGGSSRKIYICDSGLEKCVCDIEHESYLNTADIKFELNGSYSDPVTYTVKVGNRISRNGTNGGQSNFTFGSYYVFDNDPYLSIYLEDGNKNVVFAQCKNRNQGDKIFIVDNI